MPQGIACLHVAMVWLFCGPALHQVNCASSEVHLKLLEDLEGNYTSVNIRPVNDTTKPVAVGFRFAPLIASLDASKQEMIVRGMLAMKWTDHRLRWQPTDYGDIKETTIHLSLNGNQKFWIPELSLYESLVTDFHSFYPETSSITLTHLGEIHWYTLATTKSYCLVDNRDFPFDTQDCNLTFTTWLYQTNEQQFYSIDDIMTNETYKKYGLPNALWTVKVREPPEVNTASYQCETCADEKQSFIRYRLVLIRNHSLVFVWKLLLPCVVISILMAFVPFMTQRTEVDVPNYALTCVLALFVYLVYLYTALPSTGPALLVGIYITAIIVGGLFTVGIAVFDKPVLSTLVPEIAPEQNEQGEIIVEDETSLISGTSEPNSDNKVQSPEKNAPKDKEKVDGKEEKSSDKGSLEPLTTSNPKGGYGTIKKGALRYKMKSNARHTKTSRRKCGRITAYIFLALLLVVPNVVAGIWMIVLSHNS